jgi:hypothetical protein
MQALVQLEIKGQSMQNRRFYLLLSFFTGEKGQNFVSAKPLTDREDGKNDGYYHVSRITYPQKCRSRPRGRLPISVTHCG